jgi:hypothetical protein
MTDRHHISIAAFVSERERPAIQLAAGHVARALNQAAGISLTCECSFSPGIEKLADGASIIVTSLLPELEKIEVPWGEAEQRLRKIYATLGEKGVPVFICTILRHIGSNEGFESVAALRMRIRRLNLLAAEISRETGAYVIDIDRALADIGARRLQTDYRLAGNTAVDMASHFIAVTLVNNGLDERVPFEVQESARAIVISNKPAVTGGENAAPELTARRALISLGQGRRKQMVAPVAYAEDGHHAGWLIGQVLRGSISPAETLQRLRNAMRRRGVFRSAALLASGLSRQINRSK